MTNSKNYEILAPAGSVESLVRAVNCGADAVYLGLDKFNARMKAENFSIANLRQWTDYCHIFGVKVFVTVNISIKPDEFSLAKKMLCEIYNSLADGVILTDLALIEYAGKTFAPPFEVIASTQLNIHDVYGAKFVEQLGATKVVLARETSYENISRIKNQTNIAIECFIHGAMCVCQSGQCLLSSLVGGNSGNRGLCAQPCRQLYDCVQDGKVVNSGYLFSTKDLCGIDIAKDLFDLGVSSFKIEGRGRRSQYVGVASRVYSKLFENDFVACEGDICDLSRVYNRGHYLSSEYLRSQNDGIIYPKAQGHIGLEVGIFRDGKLHLTEDCEAGDSFKILRKDLEVGNATATQSGKSVACSLNGKLQNGDTVCITTDLSQLKEIDSITKKLPVAFDLLAKAGSKLQLKAVYSGIKVQIESSFECEIANKQATTVSELCEQLQKTGNSCYTISNIVIDTDGVFVPKSIVNALRREVLDKLTESILTEYNSVLNRNEITYSEETGKTFPKATPRVAVICGNLADFKSAILDSRLSQVIAKIDDIHKVSLQQYAKVADGRLFYIDIPAFADLDFLANVILQFPNVGLVANNVGAVYLAQTKKLPYVAGMGLNIFNMQSASILTPDKQPYVISSELTLNEASEEFGGNYLQFVDGQIVVMKLQHCPNKLNTKQNCSNCDFKSMQYIDRLQNSFTVNRLRCPNCTFEVVNGKKLSVAAKLKRKGSYLVDYSAEVIEHYLLLNTGIDDGYVENEPYTKGRLYDKVN